MEIAAEHAEAHGERAGERMEERFLLDRIELESAYISMRNQQSAAAIKADPTNAVESVENDTAVAASKTSQPAVFQPLVEFAFPRVRLENILECRCFGGHDLIFPSSSQTRGGCAG